MSPSLYGKPPHPPSVHLWVSHCLCVFVLCINVCVRKRVIEGEKGGLCAAVCTHPHANTVVISPCCRYFMCWECVVLSSHRRSKLLNVKVVLVPWPCAGANMDLGTGAECETFSSELTCDIPAARWVSCPIQVRVLSMQLLTKESWPALLLICLSIQYD